MDIWVYSFVGCANKNTDNPFDSFKITRIDFGSKEHKGLVKHGHIDEKVDPYLPIIPIYGERNDQFAIRQYMHYLLDFLGEWIGEENNYSADPLLNDEGKTFVFGKTQTQKIFDSFRAFGHLKFELETNKNACDKFVVDNLYLLENLSLGIN